MQVSSIDQKMSGTTILMNIALFIVLFVIGAVLIGVLAVCRAYVVPRCCKCAQWVCQALANRLMYNSVIRGLLEAYFIMSISAVYQARYADFGSAATIADFVVAVLILAYLVALPVFSLRFLLKNQSKLRTPLMRNKYGSLY